MPPSKVQTVKTFYEGPWHLVERQNVDTTFCHCKIGRMTECRKTKGRNEQTAQCHSVTLQSLTEFAPTYPIWLCMHHFGNMEYFKSQKGKPKLTLEGYVYTKDKSKDDKHYWRCEDRMCRGRLTLKGEVVLSTTAHTHAPDSIAVQVCSLFIFFSWREEH